MQISRRDALMGATAAVVVTGAAVAALAIRAAGAQAALAGEPLLAMERQMLVRGDFLDNRPGVAHSLWEAVFKEWSAL